MTKPDIVLCTPVRTPIASYGGALKDTLATDLGAAMIREALRRPGLAAEVVDQAPSLVPGARGGQRMGVAQMLDSVLRDVLHDAFSGQHSGWRWSGDRACAGGALIRSGGRT